jgi:hypothetical protein
MDLTRLARWRDTALVLLAAEAFFTGLMPALVLYWILRVLPQFRQQLLQALLEARDVLDRVQHTTTRVSDAVATPFIWLHSAAAALRRSLQCLGWRSE